MTTLRCQFVNLRRPLFSSIITYLSLQSIKDFSQSGNISQFFCHFCFFSNSVIGVFSILILVKFEVFTSILDSPDKAFLPAWDFCRIFQFKMIVEPENVYIWISMELYEIFGLLKFFEMQGCRETLLLLKNSAFS